MGKMIAQFGDKYVEWSSVVDAPVTYLMTEEELKQYLLGQHGYKEGLWRLEDRMARVHEKGTSSRMGETRQDLLRSNRAGEKEKTIRSEAKMVERYSQPAEASVPLDLSQPLELVDPYGYMESPAPVIEIITVAEDFVLARVKLAELEGPVVVMFSAADGEVLSKNFGCDGFEIQNVAPDAEVADAAA